MVFSFCLSYYTRLTLYLYRNRQKPIKRQVKEVKLATVSIYLSTDLVNRDAIFPQVILDASIFLQRAQYSDTKLTQLD